MLKVLPRNNDAIVVVPEDKILGNEYRDKVVLAVEHYTNEAYIVIDDVDDRRGSSNHIMKLIPVRYSWRHQIEYDTMDDLLKEFDVYMFDSLEELVEQKKNERWCF
jgi:hypothetical protein